MFQIWHYILYCLKAKNAHGLHSPFLYQLYTQVIAANKHYAAFDEAQAWRKQLLKHDEIITVDDFGAGSKVFKSNQRSVKSIAKYASSSPKTARLLFRMIDYFRPHTIFDLGTNLGLTTFYLSKAATRQAQIYTFEGCSELVRVAHQYPLSTCQNITFVQGNLNQTLPDALHKIEQLDFVYFDANHSKDASIFYFEQCLTKTHSDSVFILADIRWSKAMYQAWQAIQAHPKVHLSLDLFDMGVLFFKKELSKEHFFIWF